VLSSYRSDIMILPTSVQFAAPNRTGDKRYMNVMPNQQRRLQLKFLAALGAVGLARSAFATGQYPDKLIRMVSPFGAGGVTDSVARLVAQQLQKEVGQTVVVDNVAGGSGIIGTHTIARAKPDGYSLLFSTNVHVINPALRSSLPFDPVKAFSPIVKVASAPLMLVVNAASPYKTVADYVAAARSKPGELAYGSSGVGTSPHLAAEQFGQVTKTSYVHVPYNVSSAVTQAVVAGQIVSSWSGVHAAMPFVKAGKVRALGVASDHRSHFAPDVPTFAELGIHGVNIDTWFGLFGPANLPADIEGKLSSLILKALELPAFKESLVKLGAEAAPAGPAEFRKIVGTELASYAQLVKARGIKVE